MRYMSGEEDARDSALQCSFSSLLLVTGATGVACRLAVDPLFN